MYSILSEIRPQVVPGVFGTRGGSGADRRVWSRRMLKLADFYHLPEVDTLLAQLVTDRPGLVLVAGLDARPMITPAAGEALATSGRSTIFRIVMRELLAAHPAARSFAIATDRAAVRIPREFQRQVQLSLVHTSSSYSDQIAAALVQQPDIVVLDYLGPENIAAALAAARQGTWVLSQLDTFYMGADLIPTLQDMGATHDQLAGLTGVLAVQRMPRLCAQCREPVTLLPAQRARLARRFGWHTGLLSLLDGDGAGEAGFFQVGGCAQCDHTGYHGDILVFDVFRPDGDSADWRYQFSALPLDEYVLRLALQGYMALGDVLDLDGNQFRRAYQLLAAGEQALAEANATLGSKLLELEAANRVLEQRTGALISLHEMGQSLITTDSLDELAALVCRRARELCGADRAILYGFHSDASAEVMGVSGWASALVHRPIDPAAIASVARQDEPVSFQAPLPGLAPGDPAAREFAGWGLAVPLLAQQKRVGLMIVHAATGKPFAPGPMALLQTFANQAALAIQRTQLIEELRGKIAQLEAAQAGLAQKERMERELELARQVQQSVLPRTFPQVAGYRFAAMNEPARQVGGDFYDVIGLDDDHFGVLIADVSGKGMPAALYMALTRSLLLAESRRDLSPLPVLLSVNDLLMRLGQPNMFVTVFYGVIDRRTRHMTYVRAGHDRPLLLRAGQVTELDGQGMALGLFGPDMLRMDAESVTLQAGDRLVLYTDGLTDAVGPDGQFFDLARFRALVHTHGTLPPDAMCSAVFEGLTAFRGSAEQFDDMTMLLLCVE